MWLQDRVSQKVIALNKVSTDDKLADAFTKGVDAYSISKRLGGVGVVLREDRHPLAHVLEDKGGGPDMKMGDEG